MSEPMDFVEVPKATKMWQIVAMDEYGKEIWRTPLKHYLPAKITKVTAPPLDKESHEIH